MLFKILVFLRDSVAMVSESSGAVVRWLKECSQQIWENTTIKKWPIAAFAIAIEIFERFEKSLEDIRAALRYRIYYEQVTAPMKEYYRILRKQPRAY